MAYERAVVSIRDLEVDLAAIADQGNLKDIPGIDTDLSEIVEEDVLTGEIRR